MRVTVRCSEHRQHVHLFTLPCENGLFVEFSASLSDCNSSYCNFFNSYTLIPTIFISSTNSKQESNTQTSPSVSEISIVITLPIILIFLWDVEVLLKFDINLNFYSEEINGLATINRNWGKCNMA